MVLKLFFAANSYTEVPALGPVHEEDLQYALVHGALVADVGVPECLALSVLPAWLGASACALCVAAVPKFHV